MIGDEKQIGQPACPVVTVRRHLMKNNTFAALLVGSLFVCGAASATFAFTYSFSASSLRRLQPQVMAAQARLNAGQALLNDTLEYSKRNPAIDSLLQSLSLKTNAVAAAAPKPASK
jgi:hypothetical protein